MQKPIEQILSQKLIENYDRKIFVFTDGEIQDVDGLIKHVEENLGEFSEIHTIGIGSSSDENLVVSLSKAGKGHFSFVKQVDTLTEKMVQFLECVLSEVYELFDFKFDESMIRCSFPCDVNGVNLYKNEVFNFYALSNKRDTNVKEEGKFSYKIKRTNGEETYLCETSI